MTWRPHFQSSMDSHHEDQEFMLDSMNSANFEGKLACSREKANKSGYLQQGEIPPLPEHSPAIHPAPCNFCSNTGPVLPALIYVHLLISCSYTARQRPMQRVGKALQQAYSTSATQVIYCTHSSNVMNQNKTPEL